MFGEILLPGLQMVIFLKSPHVVKRKDGKRERKSEECELSDVSSYKDINPVGSGSNPMTSFNFNYCLRGPASKWSHIVG